MAEKHKWNNWKRIKTRETQTHKANVTYSDVIPFEALSAYLTSCIYANDRFGRVHLRV